MYVETRISNEPGLEINVHNAGQLYSAWKNLKWNIYIDK